MKRLLFLSMFLIAGSTGLAMEQGYCFESPHVKGWFSPTCGRAHSTELKPGEKPYCNVTGCSQECYQDPRNPGWFSPACGLKHSKQLSQGFKPTCVVCKRGTQSQQVIGRGHNNLRYCFEHLSLKGWFSPACGRAHSTELKPGEKPYCNVTGCSQECYQDPRNPGWFSPACGLQHSKQLSRGFKPTCVVCKRNTQSQQVIGQVHNNHNKKIRFFFNDDSRAGKYESFNPPYDFLSNFYPSPLTLTLNGRGWDFLNAEAAFQAKKFEHNTGILTKLSQARTGYDAWKISRSPGANTQLWHQQEPGTGRSYKENWMYTVVYEKFRQNAGLPGQPVRENLAQQLKNTGTAELVEWTVKDGEWGVIRSTGLGHNKLGTILDEVRTQLIQQRQQHPVPQAVKQSPPMPTTLQQPATSQTYHGARSWSTQPQQQQPVQTAATTQTPQLYAQQQFVQPQVQSQQPAEWTDLRILQYALKDLRNNNTTALYKDLIKNPQKWVNIFNNPFIPSPLLEALEKNDMQNARAIVQRRINELIYSQRTQQTAAPQTSQVAHHPWPTQPQQPLVQQQGYLPADQLYPQRRATQTQNQSRQPKSRRAYKPGRKNAG